MKKIKIFIAAMALLNLFGPLAQAEAPYIAVGQARTKKTILALPAVRFQGARTLQVDANTIQKSVLNDLTFMDLFKFMPEAAFIENAATSGIAPNTFKFSDWTSIGAEILIKGGVGQEGSNLVFEGFVYDTTRARVIFSKRYIGKANEANIIGHAFSNDIVQALTGLPGIFLTKIVMTCDRTNKKEIYTMNFDGTDVKQITHHQSIAFAPAWHPDGAKIAYSLYTRHSNNVRNIDLYEFDFITNKIRLLSNRQGINSGAAYSPDGRRLALTMSFLGNPEVFILDTDKGAVTRLTHSFGFDVDPSWSPDGTKMAFVTSRTGRPMVFSMDASGVQEPKRLTFAGRYNATPSWSIQNNKIAFAGWKDSHFDIFIMNPDGTNIERLTKAQGNNEDPHFSPDGNFIAFSSNRTGSKNIYVMNVDGSYVRRLTYGLGNCVAPKWSLPPR